MTPLLQLTILTTFVVLSYGAELLGIKPDVNELLLKEGSSQTLECSYGKGDIGTLDWDFPDTKGGISIDTRFKDGQHKSDLKITNFTAAGDYTCKFSSKDGAVVLSDVIILTKVEEDKVEPIFHYGNTSATLSCGISWSKNNEPDIEKVTWKKENTLVSALPEGQRFKIDATNSLVIQDPKQGDIGVYTAEIKIQGVDAPYKCKVSFKAEVVNYDFVGGDFTLMDKQGADVKSAVLTCKSNNPNVQRKIETVEWFMNNTHISKLEKPDRFQVNPENYTLTIDSPRCSDSGPYIARFTLEGSTEAQDCLANFKCSPKVKDFAKSKNLIEKDKMELQCTVTGYPKAEVVWYKDSVPLNASMDERIELFTLNGYKDARLVIKSIEFSDEGEYTCSAYSDYFNQSANKTITVRVKDKLAALWPFLGIVCEVIILCTIIFIYEKRRNKRAEQEENKAQEADGPSMEKKDGLRHRGNSGNPGA